MVICVWTYYYSSFLSFQKLTDFIRNTYTDILNQQNNYGFPLTFKLHTLDILHNCRTIPDWLSFLDSFLQTDRIEFYCIVKSIGIAWELKNVNVNIIRRNSSWW